MLARVEKGVAVLSWLAAAAVVLMLFVGPQIVADDKAKPSGEEAKGTSPYAGGSGGGGAAADGKKVFTDNCGSCHTLSAAGTNGQVGPNLDNLSLSAADVEAKVRQGGGAMPSFDGKLSDGEITAVAKFVAGSR